MKTLFVDTRYAGDPDLKHIKTDKLPARIGLVSTVQYVDFLKAVKDYLEAGSRKVLIEKGLQQNPGQILGCEFSSTTRIAALVDAFLFIGDGDFHPLGVSLKTGKPVFVYNPLSEQFSKVEKAHVERIKMKKKAQLLKFYSSNKVGVIISVKPGQNNFAGAQKLKAAYKDKEFYFILFDNVDFSQLENFNFVECWVNTACPRMQEDYNLLNLEDLGI